ncbi:ArsR/SmtB family transcription factor [Desulfocurvus sp. DL9XJH121]
MSEAQITQYFKALADSTRVRLMRILLEHELSVGELVEVLGMSQPRVSRHLKILAEAGLVTPRRDGQWVFYRAAEEGPGRGWLLAVGPLLAAEGELDADAAAAASAVAGRRGRSERFFERHADSWDRLCQETLGGFDLAEELVRRMPEVATAVDLGCGTGRLLARMRGRAGALIGVDSSQPMLERARANLGGDGPGLSLRIGDLEHLPLADGEADLAVMSLALHHLPSPQGGIREAWRVLAPGGTFLLADFEPHQREDLREHAGDHWLGFEPSRVSGWLQGEGFVIRKNDRLSLPSGLVLRLFEAEKHSTKE